MPLLQFVSRRPIGIQLLQTLLAFVLCWSHNGTCIDEGFLGLLRHFCEYGEWVCELAGLWQESMKDSNLSFVWVCRRLVKRLFRGMEDTQVKLGCQAGCYSKTKEERKETESVRTTGS